MKLQYKKILIYLFLFTAIYSTSMYMMEEVSGNIQLALLFSSAFLIWLLNTKINKRTMIFSTIMIVLIIVSILANGIDNFLDIQVIVTIVSSFLICNGLKKKQFMENYCNIILFLAIISLVCFVLYRVAPGIYDFFPTNLWRYGSTRFVNLFFVVIPVGMSDYFRNFGIFYEPGIFQIYLNIALFYELFRENIKFKRVLLILITIITTMSTNGYITAILIIAVYGYNILGKRDVSKKVKYLYLATIIIGFIIMIIMVSSGYIGERVFTKFTETRDSGSTFDRLNAIVYAIEKYISSPVLGVGFAGYSDAYNATCTSLNWFALYGTFFGILMNVSFIKFFSIMGKDIFTKILIVLVILTLLISQEMTTNCIVWCIAIYGSLQFILKPRGIKKEAKNEY